MQSLRSSLSSRSQGAKYSSLLLSIRHESIGNRIVIVVEGDTDVTLFNMVLRKNEFYYCTPKSGKGEVIEFVKKLKKEVANKVYGVVDADFDHIIGKTYENTFMTDKHDSEVMMLNLNFMIDFLIEHTVTDKLQQIDINHDALELFNNIMSICNKIGILKLACKMIDLNVMFKGISYKASDSIIINNYDFIFDIDTLVDYVIERSPRVTSDDKEKILAKYYELLSENHCIYQTTNGHDFCQLLAETFKQSFSNDKKLNDKAVEKYLRSKYTLDHFIDTNLYKNINSLLMIEEPQVVF